MNTQRYLNDQTGLLLVDPYNDLLSEGGKLYGQARPMEEATGALGNLLEKVREGRSSTGDEYRDPGRHRR